MPKFDSERNFGFEDSLTRLGNDTSPIRHGNYTRIVDGKETSLS
jgi:hypothetical protein